MARGEGTTTKQIQDAPKDAIFVWCNGHLSYPTHLARHLGRPDIKIEGPSFFESDRWRGQRNRVIVDHALDIFRFPERWRAHYFEVMDYLAARQEP